MIQSAIKLKKPYLGPFFGLLPPLPPSPPKKTTTPKQKPVKINLPNFQFSLYAVVSSYRKSGRFNM